jgi:hypothetical protein
MFDTSDKARALLDHLEHVTQFAGSEAYHYAMWDVLNGDVTDLDGFIDAIGKHADQMTARETLSKEETTHLVRQANHRWHEWARSLRGNTQAQDQHITYGNLPDGSYA